jgi:pimeloyl-ACP methyl ester carboxylesterase
MTIADRAAITFVLIHGAWHGGWCFDRLTASLQERGYPSVTMDLPVEDAAVTFQDYAQTVIDAMADIDGDVVLVGHSLGAMTLPLVAARHPARALIYLCGIIPKPGGEPWDDGPDMTEPGLLEGLVAHDDGSTSWPSAEVARQALHSDCSREDAEWAFARLRSQNPAWLWREPYPEVDVSPIKQVSIAGINDRVVTLPWSRHVASTRLGVEPIELHVGHSPFLSHPDLLADVLVGVTGQEPGARSP